MKEIVFLGAKDIAVDCLKWLLIHSAQYKIRLKSIGTKLLREENPIFTLAKENSIPIFSHQDDIPECDFILSIQYHDILRKKNIQKARSLAVNLHLAPIPEYRGCNQFSFAIMNDEKEFGVTLHKIDERIDHGDIIGEKRFEIPTNIWVDELRKISVEHGFNLFKEKFSEIIQESYSMIDWKKLNRKERIYYRKDIEKIKKIDLEMDSPELIQKKVRACSMPGFPPPYFIINTKKIELNVHENDK